MKLIQKTDTMSLLLVMDSRRNKIFLIQLDTANKSIKKKIINEKTFLVDTLHISNYSYFINEGSLYLFLFDEFSNSMLNYKMKIETQETMIINNINISLDSLDFIHHSMNCSKIGENNYHCIFVGTNKLTILEIKPE